MKLRTAMSSSRGFTLLELMVAMGLAAVLLAVTPFAVERMFDGAQYRATVREVATAIRLARQEALKSGQEQVFGLDLEARRFGVGDRLRREIPTGLDVSLVVAESELSPEGLGWIRFYPDGSSTGGSVMIARQEEGAGGTQLRVSWLLGRLSLHPV